MAADDTPNVLQLQQYAEQLARDMYPSQGGQYDQQDAARHMLAAGTLARKYGADTAEFLGKAHEHVTSPLKSLMTLFGGKMPNDYEQDLYNNALGIQLSKGAKSQADLEELVNRYAEGASKDKTYGRPWTGKPKKNYAEGGEAELAPYGLRHSGEGAKGLGYFGKIPARGGYATELSSEDDIGEYPLLVPGLSWEEIQHLVNDGEPTEEIHRKAYEHADKRRAAGKSTFIEQGELRHPMPAKYAMGGAVANMTEDPGWDDGGAVGPDQAGVNKMVAMQGGGLVYDPAEIERMAAEL